MSFLEKLTESPSHTTIKYVWQGVFNFTKFNYVQHGKGLKYTETVWQMVKAH
jgi:hypothetical protein